MLNCLVVIVAFVVAVGYTGTLSDGVIASLQLSEQDAEFRLCKTRNLCSTKWYVSFLDLGHLIENSPVNLEYGSMYFPGEFTIQNYDGPSYTIVDSPGNAPLDRIDREKHISGIWESVICESGIVEVVAITSMPNAFSLRVRDLADCEFDWE